MRTLLLFCLLIVGCAGLGNYRPLGFGGGYVDTQLAERLYEVEFRGNGYIGQATVEAYTMRRAAEIAASRGFAGFVEVQASTSTDQSLAYVGEQAQVVSKHAGKKRIYLLTAEEMRANPAALDAKIILSRWAEQTPRSEGPADYARPAPEVTPASAPAQSP
jgi:hypothetical protein